MPSVLICYIDDQVSDDAERYRERLSRSPNIECELIPPPSWEEIEDLVADPPDLFLIDYKLSLTQPDGTRAAYQGSTLADAIRDKAPDCPIVLITRQTILNDLTRERRRQLTEQMQMFDELILKSLLDDELERAHHLLVSMAEGFRALSEIEEKTWEPLVEVLETSEEEAEVLGEAAPPLQKGEWTVTGMAYWIRNVILEFPGTLYDPINAATRLGISEDSFWTEEVQELLEPAKYTGVFAPLDGRWWKGRLFKIAQDLAIEVGVRGPTKRAFREAFQRRFGSDLSPAICVWDKTPIAEWVCYILSQPVKMANSLRYYPDRRPSVMDDARVSFLAIQTDPEFNEEYLDSEGLRLLEEILEMPEP